MADITKRRKFLIKKIEDAIDLMNGSASDRFAATRALRDVIEHLKSTK